jgi:ubiquinone/menaquinone biosynthesis C-methylase UbiE
LPRLTAIEADQDLAQLLRARLRSTNVEVVNGDATSILSRMRSFQDVRAFTMLHHVPSPALQDKLLSEVWRVLKPGGFSSAATACKAYSCECSIWVTRLSPFVRIPLARLEGAGLEVIELEKGSGAFRFYAIKPMRRA